MAVRRFPKSKAEDTKLSQDLLNVTNSTDIILIEPLGELPKLSLDAVSSVAIGIAQLLDDRVFRIYFGKYDYLKSGSYWDVNVNSLNIHIRCDLTLMDFESVKDVVKRIIALFGYNESSEFSNGQKFSNYFEFMMKASRKSHIEHEANFTNDLCKVLINKLNLDEEKDSKGNFEAFVAGLPTDSGINVEDRTI